MTASPSAQNLVQDKIQERGEHKKGERLNKAAPQAEFTKHKCPEFCTVHSGEFKEESGGIYDLVYEFLQGPF